MQLPPPSSDAQPVKIVRRGPIIAVIAVTAVALVVIGQFVMRGSSPPGYDASGYEGATAVTLAGQADTAPAVEKFHATDWRFRAAFPSPPQRSTEPMPFAPTGRTLDVVAYTATDAQAEYVVGVLPISGLAGLDYTQALEAVARADGARLESSRPTTFNGYRAAEGLMRSAAGRFRVLMFGTADRVFIVYVGAAADPVAQYEPFRDSLEIL